MLIQNLQELSKKENLVFVGSVAMMLHGFDIKPRDIDIVVTDLQGLKNYTEYKTNSKFSLSGKRAYIQEEIVKDIFIEDELPQFNIINGFKCVTIESMKNYLQMTYELVDDYWKKIIKEKLNLLGEHHANRQKY